MNESGIKLIESVRQLDEKLRKLTLSSVVIFERIRKIQFNFICDKTIDDTLKGKITEIINEFVPDSFKGIEVNISKVVADNEIALSYLNKFILKEFPYFSEGLNEGEVFFDLSSEIGVFKIVVPTNYYDYAVTNKLTAKILEYLQKELCKLFSGEIIDGGIKKKEEYLPKNTVYIERQEEVKREIILPQVEIIDKVDLGKVATYIEDAVTIGSTVVLCGKILDIQERMTKNNKPFLVISFSDTTATITGRYFSKQKTYDKIKEEILLDEYIVCEVEVGEYNGDRNYTIKNINKCAFPEDFVKISKASLPPPPEYSVVFPEKIVDENQEGMFDDNTIPQRFFDDVYVVLDTETTGVTSDDKLTEIGAVKLVNGKVVEKFSTFVNPERSIPQKVVDLTGITDDMVADAPLFESVVGDLYKLTHGAIIVGHNVEFDMRFIKTQSSDSGYVFSNKIEDTLFYSRRLFPQLHNHKLDTIADYFGFTFRHHRAFDDAYVTAKCYMELIKIFEKRKNGQ